MTPQPAETQAVREIYALLRLAAARRQPVAATYDGLLRLLCPHVLGRKSGSLHVFCYQFGGNSSSGLPMAPGRVSVAPAEGAIFLPHLSLVVRRAFLSPTSLAERSSPSRVRFAAPNNGAPLTAQGRSELTPPDKRERLIPEGCGHLGAKGAKMAPFFTATDTVDPMGRPKI